MRRNIRPRIRRAGGSSKRIRRTGGPSKRRLKDLPIRQIRQGFAVATGVTRALPIFRVFAYWRAERRTIRQGLVALVLATVGNVAAGVILGSIAGTLEAIPGLLVLLPAANSIRGSIFGSVSARLGTSIHIGGFEPSRRRDGPLYQNVYAAFVLTLAVSLLLGVMAKGTALGFGLPSTSVADLIVISVLGGVMASVVVGAISAALAVGSWRYAWDLDSVGAPLVTAIGDVVTIPALFVATAVATRGAVTGGLAGALTLVTIVFTIRAVTTDLPAARNAVREGMPILVLTASLSLLAGLVVETRVHQLVAIPALLILIPPLLSDTGALAAVLSSRVTTKLHLGSIEPTRWPQGLAFLDASIVLLFSVWVFALVGAATHLVAIGLGIGTPGLGALVGTAMLAGATATAALVVLAYYVAIFAYRVGLDPDNHVIPIITSVADLIGVLMFTVALAVFGLA